MFVHTHTHRAPSLLGGKSPCLVCDILPPEQQTFQSTTGRCFFFVAGNPAKKTLMPDEQRNTELALPVRKYM